MPFTCTNTPKSTTPVTSASNSSPSLSRMYSHFSHDMASRVASSARRSLNEHCWPSAAHGLLRPGERRRIAAAQDMANAAMDHQIGIAADRRSEVRVLRQGQAEVTDVRRLIDGLRQRAHDHRFDQARLLAGACPLQHGAQIVGLQLAIGRQMQAEAAQELAQLFESIRFGLSVHAIQRREPGACAGIARPARWPRSCIPRSGDAHRCAAARRRRRCGRRASKRILISGASKSSAPRLRRAA